MSKKKLPNSIKRYIRKEKARIRKGVLGLKEQGELINNVYGNVLNNQKRKAEEVKTKKESKK